VSRVSTDDDETIECEKPPTRVTHPAQRVPLFRLTFCHMTECLYITDMHLIIPDMKTAVL